MSAARLFRRRRSARFAAAVLAAVAALGVSTAAGAGRPVTGAAGSSAAASEGDPVAVGLRAGDQGAGVRRLQLLLLSAGFDVEVTARFDAATTDVVKRAQQLLGFPVDGVASDEFVAALSPQGSCRVAVVADGGNDVAVAYLDVVEALTGCTVSVDVDVDRELVVSSRCRAGSVVTGLLGRLGLDAPESLCARPVSAPLVAWGSSTRFDVVVVDAGASDAFRVGESVLRSRWVDILGAAASPMVVFVTVDVAPYDDALRAWCAEVTRCLVAPVGTARGVSRAEVVASAVSAALVLAPPR